MKKVEAATLEAAYAKAAKALSCSVSELQSEVVQHPSKGLFGFMKKNAIIVASCSKSKKVESPTSENSTDTIEESVATEILDTVKKTSQKEKSAPVERKTVETKTAEKNAVLDNFFEADAQEEHSDEIEEEYEEENVVYDELALMIENQLKELLSHSCFDIDVVEVDVHDNTALIFIDGEDAALLIGKEGYRYNALSYMIFNWLHSKYELFIKLEIAEFLTTQQEMIRNYIKPLIESVEKEGKGKTRFLDGILVQIALEQLREKFPDKYVAVKSTREGKKFVVINEFNSPAKSRH
ncbi:MAG: protein jag [Sulfurovum sp.]|nr:protein jag [Sulfurovum sp.]